MAGIVFLFDKICWIWVRIDFIINMIVKNKDR